LPLLNRKPALEDYYSKKTAALAKKVEVDPKIIDGSPVDTDDDLSDLDMTLAAEVESDAEIMRALDPSDNDTPDNPDPVALVADWLADVRELSRKHGPFARWQIDQIIRELNAPGNEAVR
jgi:hypothetical protein